MSRGRSSIPPGKTVGRSLRGRSSREGQTGSGSGREGTSGSALPPTGEGWRVPDAEATDAGFDADVIDPAELREFLAADLLDVEADPIFKERLRQKLWRLVRQRYGDGVDED